MAKWSWCLPITGRQVFAGLISLVMVLLLHWAGFAQTPENSPASPNQSSTTTPEQAFFADVLVRGQPVLQVGSLDNLSAMERANQINRRIAGLLRQTEPPDPVTVNFASGRDLATLQVNNRVIMTVTAQDALDFDTTVEALAERWAEELNQNLRKPNLAVEIVQRLEGTSELLIRNIIDQMPSILGALLVALFTWIAALGVRQGALIWAEQTEGDRNTEILISRLCYGGVWLIGAIVALGVLGLNFTALLGTLGLTGVAIGFGLKDILSNYLSGLILLAARPFRIGDEVVIDAYEGRVIQIQLRATTVQTYDGRLVYIPNQEVFQSSITNNTASPVRRSSVMIGIDYDADLGRAQLLILEAVSQTDGVENDPPPVVLVRELAASTVNVETRFWVNSRRQSFLQVTSRVSAAVKAQLQQAKVEMPTDIYTIQFRNTPNQLQPATANPEPADSRQSQES